MSVREPLDRYAIGVGAELRDENVDDVDVSFPHAPILLFLSVFTRQVHMGLFLCPSPYPLPASCGGGWRPDGWGEDVGTRLGRALDEDLERVGSANGIASQHRGDRDKR